MALIRKFRQLNQNEAILAWSYLWRLAQVLLYPHLQPLVSLKAWALAWRDVPQLVPITLRRVELKPRGWPPPDTTELIFSSWSTRRHRAGARMHLQRERRIDAGIP